MGKWFQRKNFSTKKWRQDPNARKAHRVLGILLAAAVVFQALPLGGIAVSASENGGGGLCEHHTEHTPDCGYMEGHSAEGECTHEHTEDCYKITESCIHEHTESCYQADTASESEGSSADAGEKQPVECSHLCSEESGCVVKELDCHHEHDESCGYREETEGSPCTFVCEICNSGISEDDGKENDSETGMPGTETEEEIEEETEEMDSGQTEEPDEGQEDTGISFIEERIAALPDAADITEENRPGLRLFGQDVYDGDSGEGWSYQNGVLTLENYHADDASGDFLFINGYNTTMDFTLYLKGNNSVKTDRTLIYGSAENATITGDPGATLSLDGMDVRTGDLVIRDITLNVTTQKYVFFSQGMMIDNATANFNMSGSEGYIYATFGGVTIQNGSDVTVNSLGTSVCCIYANESLVVTDSTLKMTNTNPDGHGAYVTEVREGVEHKAVITNSVISADVGLTGIHCDDDAVITNSQITSGGQCVIRSKSAVAVDGSSKVEGIVQEHFRSKDGIPRAYQVYGQSSMTADLVVNGEESFTVPKDAALTIPAGMKLENNGTMHIHDKTSLTGAGVLTGNGSFLIDVNEDLISVPEGWSYTGKDLSDQIKNAASLDGDMTVCGQTFHADTDGWEASVKKISELNYTVTYTHKEKGSVSKAVAIAKAQTVLPDIATYKADGITSANTFGIGEKMIIKATPVFPDNNTVMAAAFTEPAGGQMAVCYGGQQISEPVGAGADGAYVMTVDSNDLPPEALNKEITLTVKYMESGNALGAEGTAAVTVTAAAKVETDGSASFFPALSEAFESIADAEKTRFTVTLLRDQESADSISVKNGNSYKNKNITLELNGKKITSSVSGKGAMEISGDAPMTFTVRDSSPNKTGGMNGQNGYGILLNNKDVILHLTSGSFSGQISGVQAVSGTLWVSGNARISKLYAPNDQQGATTIQLWGGIFSDGIVVGEGLTLKGILDTSRNVMGMYYAYFDQNGSPITEGLDEGSFSSGVKNVTVGECGHTKSRYEHTNATTVHTRNCPACGETGKVEKCSFSESGKCVCGAVLAVMLPDHLNLTYIGEAQEPAVSVTLDGTKLTAEDYNVTYANNINAGINSAVVTVTGQGNYSFEAEKTFSIEKAEQKDFAVKAVTMQFEKNGTFTLTATGGNGDGAILYRVPEKNGVLVVSGNKATMIGGGTVAVTATKAESANYKAATATAAITITKAPAPVITYPKAGSITYGQELSDSILAGGSTEYGSFAWKDGSTVPIVNNTGYTVVFTVSEETERSYEKITDVAQNVLVEVEKAVPAVSITAAVSGSKDSRQAVLTVNAAKAGAGAFPTGTVTLTDCTGGTEVEIGTVTLNNGSAAYTWKGLLEKEYTIKAVYAGNSNYMEAESRAFTFDAAQQDQGGGEYDEGGSAPQNPVTSPVDRNTNPGNETAPGGPGAGTIPMNPGSRNITKPGTNPGSRNTAKPGTSPGSAGTSAWGTKQPFIKGEDGKIGWDVIRAEEEKAGEGSIINVDMNGSVVVPGDIFDSIKGRDVTITFDMGGGILWSVDGKSVTGDLSMDKMGEIDFSVQTGVNTVPVEIVNNVTGEGYNIQISLSHEGEFGFTAVLSIDLGRKNAGFAASLYYYNESTGELEWIGTDKIAQDGTASFAFTHASDYVISIDAEQEEENATAESEQPEGTGGAAGTDESAGGVPESPKAGLSGEIWLALLLAAVIGTGAVFAVRKKGKEENSKQ